MQRWEVRLCSPAPTMHAGVKIVPIVEVEIVAERKLVPGLAARLAHNLAPIFGGPARGTWVKLRRLDVTAYAEGDGGPSPEVRPVFVRILKADPPTGAELREQVWLVTRVVGETCERPLENVHVIYQQSARGRVAFGGELVD